MKACVSRDLGSGLLPKTSYRKSEYLLRHTRALSQIAALAHEVPGVVMNGASASQGTSQSLNPKSNAFLSVGSAEDFALERVKRGLRVKVWRGAT